MKIKNSGYTSAQLFSQSKNSLTNLSNVCNSILDGIPETCDKGEKGAIDNCQELTVDQYNLISSYALIYF